MDAATQHVLPHAEVACDYLVLGTVGFLLPRVAHMCLSRKQQYRMEEHIPGLQSMCLVLFLQLAQWVHHPDMFAFMLDPFQLGLWWAVVWCGDFLGKYTFSCLEKPFAESFRPKNGPLMYRVNNGLTTEPTTWVDTLYYVVRELWEMQAKMLVGYYAVNTRHVPYLPSELTLGNTVCAWWLGLVLHDVMYGFGHYVLHLRWVYPYIHKHHHRYTVPGRDMEDALNYHPLELVFPGIPALVLSYWVAGELFGIHLLTYGVFLSTFLLFQCLNHSEIDVKLNLLGVQFDNGAHEMHHRIPTCNFCIYIPTFDKLCGTYREYQD
eukprot:TRINITY_DN355_c0_g1_i1.p2 TRINITY_DN355_c0_g1~~TRINITY_DN355_c0_g1_i1.p2  ORF type:complete len:321 (+),score=157.47 TRINITY_DN355_c0_g1_i1:105-1067(+)